MPSNGNGNGQTATADLSVVAGQLFSIILRSAWADGADALWYGRKLGAGRKRDLTRLSNDSTGTK